MTDCLSSEGAAPPTAAAPSTVQTLGGSPPLLRPLDDLEHEICGLAAQIASATARFLVLLAEFDEREGWAGYGVLSCAHWLTLRCGLSMVTAREHLRAAKALRSLPVMAEAFGKGQLSYSKVRALTRVATPIDDAALTELARAESTSQVERTVRAYRHAQDHAGGAVPEPVAPRLYVRWRWDDDGCLRADLRLSAEDGARWIDVLEQARDELIEERRSDAESAQAGAVAAGAHAAGAVAPSADVAEAITDDEPAQCLQPLDEASAPSQLESLVHVLHRQLDAAPDPVTVGDRCQVVVHVDTSTLAADRGALGHLENGPALPAETLRRLACDAAIVAMLRGPGGEVLDVGRRTRRIPPAIARALRVRDGGCRFPGCTTRRRLHAHHVRHWAHGGPTNVGNLLLLCPAHHKAVHDDGFTVLSSAPQQFRFVRPDGRALPGGSADVLPLDAPLPSVEADALSAQWFGDPLDLDLTILALMCLHDPALREQERAAA